jgi:hypothetical protein
MRKHLRAAARRAAGLVHTKASWPDAEAIPCACARAFAEASGFKAQPGRSRLPGRDGGARPCADGT